MHIGFVGGRAPVSPARRGAIEKLTMDHAAALVDRGHEATVITVGEDAPRTYTAEGVHMVVISAPIGRPPSHVFPVVRFGRHASRAVEDTHERRAIDVVHGVFYPNLLGFRPPDGVPLVITEHNPHPWKKEHQSIDDLTRLHWLRWEADTAIRRLEARLAMARADRVYSVSDAHGRWMEGIVPGLRQKRETMYDFVDTTRYRPVPEGAGVFDDVEGSVVLYAGRKVPHKGLHRAVAALAGMEQDAQLAVLGPLGPGFDGPDTLDRVEPALLDGYLRRVLAIARNEGVADRINFIGYVPDDTLPAYYADADVVAFPSVLESLGIVPLEAMACGTPVVAHDRPPITETVVHGETGLLVDVDTGAVAAGLDRLLADPDERSRLGRRGRQRVVEQFDVDVAVQAHLEAYRDLARR